MCEQKYREPDTCPSSKEINIMTFATEWEYWPSVKRHTQLFELVNYVVTFFEGDTVPILYEPLSFALTHGCLEQLGLQIGEVDAAKTSLLHRFNTIECDMHCLAVFPDPMVLKTFGMKYKCCLKATSLIHPQEKHLKSAVIGCGYLLIIARRVTITLKWY